MEWLAALLRFKFSVFMFIPLATRTLYLRRFPNPLLPDIIFLLDEFSRAICGKAGNLSFYGVGTIRGNSTENKSK